MLVRRPYGGLARRGENVYTDPELLDVAGALEALPNPRLIGVKQSDEEGSAATASLRAPRSTYQRKNRYGSSHSSGTSR